MKFFTASLLSLAASATMGAIDPAMPFDYHQMGTEQAVREMRKIRADYGIRRFCLTAPCFNGVMFGEFPTNLYSDIARDFAKMKRDLANEDVELSWWCAPSIRYCSNFAPIEDAYGSKSEDNKKCPLDADFARDWCAKIKSVAKEHPKFIVIEDDFTLGWGRGLDDIGACFCKRHLAEFAKRYGTALSGKEIAAAFTSRTAENLSIRRAFADTVRESLVGLARQVRSTIDEVDPSIRVMLCESGTNSERDGDALEPVARAFAGKTRPAVRPSGAIYGAETTPANIPGAIAHSMWTSERLGADVEKFYEADPYPHNRFYTSAAQLSSLIAGAFVMHADDILFYCSQYLDDPMEDGGYAEAYLALKPRLEAVKSFIRDRRSKLAGLRIVWNADDIALTRAYSSWHGQQLRWGAYLCAKFGFPYTTRNDAKGPAILISGIVEVLSDDELRELLKGGVLIDAEAAELLVQRGFEKYLGVKVEHIEGRPLVVGEEILPAAECKRAGKKVNAFYALPAGSEGTVRSFVKLTPNAGTEVLSVFKNPHGEVVMPAATWAKNSLGGRVAVLATSLYGNRSSGLYNLRKQEYMRKLFNRLEAGSMPVAVKDAPGIWTLAQVAEDGRQMLVMVNNLSGDVRKQVVLEVSSAWQGASVARLGADGKALPLGAMGADFTIPFKLEQMEPEFLVISKEDK